MLSCRELALQVAMVGRTFRKQFGYRAQAIIGGVDRDDQVKFCLFRDLLPLFEINIVCRKELLTVLE